MKAKEAQELGGRIAALVDAGQLVEAYALLIPTLQARTPFPMLRRIGAPVGEGPREEVNAFLERIEADRTEGGWVVIASALERQLPRDLPGAFARCRHFVASGDVWYAADILGEGVAGEALVAHFQPALAQITPWREDANAWVRRVVGVSAHFWAKRSRGSPESAPEAAALLNLLEPMFDEWDMRAVKGVGWGLKTLGENYPELVTEWLAGEVVPSQRRYRALMLRKSLTFLTEEQRARALGQSPTKGSEISE